MSVLVTSVGQVTLFSVVMGLCWMFVHKANFTWEQALMLGTIFALVSIDVTLLQWWSAWQDRNS